MITLNPDTATWSGTVSLYGYGDSVAAILHTSYGEYITDTIHANLWYAGKFSYPVYSLNTHNTSAVQITLKGTTFGTSAGDTVFIKLKGLSPVWINLDTVILSASNDTWQTVMSSITPAVYLSGGANIAVIKVQSPGGRVSYDTIYINFQPSGLIINFTYPSEINHDTNVKIVTIKGTTMNSLVNDTIYITVNGSTQTLIILTGANQDWSCTIGVTGPGDTVGARIWRSSDTQAYDTFILNFFDTSNINITYPSSTVHDTNTTAITIKGTSFSYIGDTLLLYVNGIQYDTRIITSRNQSWSGTVTVSGFGDSVTVAIKNKFGIITWDTIQINYFKTPTIEITYPTITTADTNILKIIISGTSANTSQGDTYLVYINGTAHTLTKNLTSANAQWQSDTCFLSNGANVIAVKMTNKFNVAAWDTITLIYKSLNIFTISGPDTAYINETFPLSFTAYDSASSVKTDYIEAMNLIIDTPGNIVSNTTSFFTAGTISNQFYHIDTYGFQISIIGTISGAASINFDGFETGVTAPATGPLSPWMYDGNTPWIMDQTQKYAGAYSMRSGVIGDSQTSQLLITKNVKSGNVAFYRRISTEANKDYLYFYIDGVLQQSLQGSITAWTQSSFAVAQGRHVFRWVYSKDPSGSSGSDAVWIDNVSFPAPNGDDECSGVHKITILTPPKIEIIYPTTTIHDTSTKTIVVRGTSVSFVNDTVYLYVNGTLNSIIPITVADSQWCGTVMLVGRGDSVVAKLQNGYNGLAYDTIQLNYYVPGIEITYPGVASHDTDFSPIIIKGTTSGTQAGDKVQLYVNGTAQGFPVALTGPDGNWTIDTCYLSGKNDKVSVELIYLMGGTVWDSITVNYALLDRFTITGPDTSYINDTFILILTAIDTANTTKIGYFEKAYMTIDTPAQILPSITNFFNAGILSQGFLIDTYGQNITITVGDTELLNTTTDKEPFETGDFSKFLWTFGGSAGWIIDSTVYKDGTYSAKSGAIGNSASSQMLLEHYNSGSGKVSFWSKVSCDTYDYLVFWIDGNIMGQWSGNVDWSHAEYDVSSGTHTFEWWYFKSAANTSYLDCVWVDNIILPLTADEKYCTGTKIINILRIPSIAVILPTINSDTDGYDTNVRNIVIYGTTQSTAGDTLFIYVNGVLNGIKPITSNDSAWAATVTLTGIGDSVVVKLMDQYTKILYDTIQVNYFAPPGIKITYPNTLTYDTITQIITISGTTANSRNGDTVEIYTNGVSNTLLVLTVTNGTFSGTAVLNGISDSILVRISAMGGLAYDTINVNYYLPPTIEITYPAYSSHDTIVQKIYIGGTTFNTRIGDTIQVYVNTALNTTIVLTTDNSNFIGTVTLTGIADSVWVKLNGFGGQSYDTIILNYFDTPVVEITYPGYISHDTNVQGISIYGTSIRSDIGDSISLFVNGTLNSTTSLISINGSWSNTVAVSNVYDSVVVKLTDRFGRTVYDTITVNYYSGANLEITYPGSTDHDTCIKIITIKGTTYNTKIGDTIAIYTNGTVNTTIAISVSNADFIGTAVLSGISDSIVARLFGFGGEYYDTVSISYDSQAPRIQVNDDSYTLKVSGDVYGPLFNIDFFDTGSGIDSAWITKNDGSGTFTIIGATGAGASYTTNFAISTTFTDALSNGDNIIRVYCIDALKNETYSIIYIAKEYVINDGDTSDFQSDEFMEIDYNNSFYLSWDDTGVYIASGGSNGNMANADLFVFFSFNSDDAGTNHPPAWDGIENHTLPRNMQWSVCLEDGGYDNLRKYSGGAWQNDQESASPYWQVYAGWAGNPLNEIRISWSEFDLPCRPETMAVMAFNKYEGTKGINASWPTQNPIGDGSSDLTFTHVYEYGNMEDTVSPNSVLFPNSAPDTPFIISPKNGAGQNDLTPTFKWVFSDTLDIQGYYQIQVDTDATWTGGLVWDSNKTAGSDTFADCSVNLTRRTKYYWRVRVWDDQNETSPWSSGTDTFWINRIIIGDGDIADWFGTDCVDTDRTTGEPILSSVQMEKKTDGGKFYWRDSIPPFGDPVTMQGDVSIQGGSYEDDVEGKFDLDSFAITADNNNLYIMFRMKDLRNDQANGAMVQVALDYQNGGTRTLRGNGTASKDAYTSAFTEWDRLITVTNKDQKIIVYTPTWVETDITAIYNDPYSEHNGNNWVEVYIPFNEIGGKLQYIGNKVKLSVVVAEASAYNGVTDFNNSVGAPVLVDCISKMPYNFNGSYDPYRHEFTINQVDSILNTYVQLEFDTNVNLTGDISSVIVFYGKNIDGNLGDWIDSEVLEVDNGDTAYVAWDDNYLFFAVDGFNLSGTGKIGIAISINDDTGVFTNNLGGPHFDPPYGPDYVIYVDDTATVMYHSSTNGVFNAGINNALAPGWASAILGNVLEMQVPRSAIGNIGLADSMCLWIFALNGNAVVNAYPLSNPESADSSMVKMIGHYLLTSLGSSYKACQSVDLNKPTVDITSISMPDSISKLGLLNSTVSAPNFYKGSLTGDSFVVVSSIIDTGSGIQNQHVVWIWNSTQAAEDQTDTDNDENGSFTITGVSDTTDNDTVILSVSARDRYGNETTDTVYIWFDNSSPTVPVVITPINNSDTSQSIVTFAWLDTIDTVSGVSYYNFQLSRNYDFTVLIADSILYNSNCTVILTDSSYFWRVAAYDYVGNTCAFTSICTFTVRVTPPSIEITYPSITLHDTNAVIVALGGTSANSAFGDSLAVSINGGNWSNTTAITAQNSDWSINSVSLDTTVIENSVTVKIFDSFGRIYYDTIVINFYSAPRIEITYPAVLVHDTITQIIIISGTTENSRPGDTIQIYTNSTLNTIYTLTSINGIFTGTVALAGISDSVWVKLNGLGGLEYDTITVNYDNIPPSPPAGFTATADVTLPDTGVQLSWSANVEPDSQYYNIYRDTTGLGVYIKINDSPVLLTNYFDSQAKRGDTQYYAVTCIDKNGNESIYSDSAGAGNIVYTKTIYGVTVGGNTVSIRPGATITYNILYTNDGFAPIRNMIIFDTISVSVVEFRTGSVQIVNGNTISATYSNDNSITFIYTPIGTVDENVTNIRLQLIGLVSPTLSGSSGNIRIGVVIK